MKSHLCKAMLLIVALTFGAIDLYAQSKPVRSTKPIDRSATAKQETEKIVRDYILKNPEIIREALAALETKEAAERSRFALTNLRSKQQEIFSTAGDPSAGNPNGDVSVAVFFDYACGYCRKTLPGLNALLAKDKAVRIVYKEFPILGERSEVAALAALAAGRQGKYLEFHNALMVSDDLSDEAIKSIAERLSLDHAKLLRDMKDPKLSAVLTANRDLANALDIGGTPGYIVNDQFIPGAIDAASLAKIVETHREKNKNKTVAISVER